MRNHLFDTMKPYFQKRQTNLKLIALLLIMGIFFSIPILFAYDSGVYLEYLDIFSGIYPWGVWGKTRGWGYPLFLWLSKVLFGETAYGFGVSCFILFLAYFYSIMQIMAKIKREKKTLYCFVLALLLVLNPIVLGYFHMMLTEALAATVTVCHACYLLNITFKRVQGCSKRWDVMKEIAVTGICSCFLFFVKQMFFIIPILLFCLSELYLLLICKSKIRVACIGLFVVMFILLVTNKGWNLFLNESAEREAIAVTDTSFADVNVSSGTFFNTYIVKGARNFKYDAQSQTIKVYRDGVQVDELNYKGKVTPIKYMATCFVKHPLLLLGGYFDGYGALINLYRLETLPGQNISDARIVKEVSFIRGYENEALACWFRFCKYGRDTYTEMGHGDKLVQYGQYTDKNLAIATIYSKIAIKCANLLFTVSLLWAPLAMIGHLIAIWVGRKKADQWYHGVQFMTAGTTFLYGMAISVMSMQIDRYMFPVLAFAIISLTCDVAFLCKKIKETGITIREKRKRKGNEDISCNSGI